MKYGAVVLVALLSTGMESLAGIDADLTTEVKKTNESRWECSFSTSTSVVLNGPDYVNPNFVANRDWLHIEARYNYEALRTGSIWLGRNFSFGDKLVLAVTPMLGGVFGDYTGIAPGYTLSVSYKSIDLFSQGEYFIDARTRGNDFFYTWTKLTVAPAHWLRLGLVVDSNKIFGTDSDIRGGPLLGFAYKKVKFTTYWLNPGSHNSAVAFSVAVKF